MRQPLLTICTVLTIGAMALAADKPADPKVARFEGLLRKVQTDPSGTREAEVQELLNLARELGRSYTASLGIRGYLSHNFKPSPALLLATAEAAYRAGDYTFAVARLKNYLAAAPPSAQAAQAAAKLYTLLIDFLGAEDDAYQFMSKHGGKFRSHPAARRFDGWFLARARARRDYVAAAETLAAALAGKMPLAQEQLYYWPHLDWLMGEVSKGSASQHAALPHCRKILPLIRADNRRSKRYALYVANLAYRAGSAGKGKEALARDYELVLRAARDYVNAFASVEAAQEALEVLAGGVGQFDGNAWNQHRDAKQAFFVFAFGKLKDKGRGALMAWGGGHRARELATPEQWVQLGAKHARLFAASPASRYVPLLTKAATRDDLRKRAAFCKGVPSEDAAIINALAASDDLNKVIDHLMGHDAWHLSADRYQTILGRLFSAYRQVHETDKKKLPGDVFEKAWLHFGTRYLASSPIAIYDVEAVKSYLRAAWRVGGKGPQDKAHMPGHLARLAWVPFHSPRQRRNARADVLNAIAGEARAWSEALRRQARKKTKDKKPAVDPALLKQIAPVLEALRKARTPGDPAKAPNELCKAMAQIALAASARKEDDRIAAERRAYRLVKDYEARKTPYGRDAFFRITSSDQRSFRNFDLQVEMLADKLTGYKPGGAGEPLERLTYAIFSHRNDWRLRDSGGRNKDRMLKLNALFAKAVTKLADRGQFCGRLFDLFRGTRMGKGWNGGAAGEDAMAKVIEKRLFHASGYRAAPQSLSATTSYMRLVKYEFPTLAKKFPVATWFDDMFVAEARKAKFLDWSYWEYGRDEKKKVAAAAARILAAQDRPPMGFDDRTPCYTLDTFNQWMDVALKADKASRDALLAKCQATYGKTRFDAYAMGYGHFTPAAAAEAKAFFRNLSTYVDRAATAPARLGMPPLAPLKNLAAKDVSDAELKVLVKMFAEAPSPWWSKDCQFDTAARIVHEGLIARKRQAELFDLVGHFWKLARDGRDYNVSKRLIALVDELRKADDVNLSLAYSTVGLTLMRGHLPDDFRSALGGIRSWALGEMGGIIPVAKGHELYSLYEAQVAYLTGKYQTAWETYLAQRQRLARSYKEFDPQFCIWVIRRNTEFKDFDAAEGLAREMLTWFDEVSERFEPEVRAGLQLAYADIATAREDRPRARALYERIVAAKEFAGTRAQLDAELRIADVDRLDGNYERATERLEKLARRKDRYLQTEAFHHLSLVKFAQEEFAEAKDQLEQVFTLSPDHAESRILEGKVNLKLKKLEQPTDIDLGEKIGKKFIVPGRPVRVTLVDRNLSIVRKASEIEIRAWTDSGDEEFFALTPFGDSKTKFKGQLATELGEVKKDDHVLQVIGKDRVHYAFSDAFAKTQKIADNRPFTLEVATDAELYASSGRILTKEQREARALEEMIRKKMGTEDDGSAVPLSTVRDDNQIKPGNKINVRVVDPDRGLTRSKDQLSVRLQTVSGDGIKAFSLTETAPYSGVFEGAVPTEPAQATAYASDSQEGTEANFAISAKAYPAWVGLPRPSRSRPKTFSVDLNDNVSLGKMKVTAKEQGRKLKEFLVQTSFNGRDFTTVGAYPKKFVPWTGQPKLEVVRYVSEDAADRRGRIVAPKTIEEFRSYLEQGYLREGQQKLTAPLKALAVNWDYKVDGLGSKMKLDSNKASHKYYMAHLAVAFHQPRRQIRSFILQPKGGNRSGRLALSYLIALDGQGASSSSSSRSRRDQEGGIEISRTVGKGVHRLDVYVFAHQHANPSFEVLCDTDKPPYVVPCRLEMFDPAKHPEIAQGLARQVADVSANAEKTEFDVAFPASSRARIVRLLLTDFEADAPAINRISLADAQGKQILPTKHDFMQLRKNRILEIVPGDRITIVYEDPKVLTSGREQHEAFLTATYTDAEISACFVDYTIDDDGQREARYIQMRRFEAGDKINVFVYDPDRDVSDKLDTVTFTAMASDGKPIKLNALETEEHSGIFLGNVFPVAGKPKRESELTVKEGDDVILTYSDRENIDPGIPWNRTFPVEQVWFEPPEVRVYGVTSLTLEEADKLAGRKARAPSRSGAGRRGRAAAAAPGAPGEAGTIENVPVRRTLLAVRPIAPEPKKPAQVVIGGPLLVEVLFPAITKSPESDCTIYVQTSSGRKKHGKKSAEPFDVTVPGTIKLTQTPGDAGSVEPPPGYRDVVVRANPYALSPLDDGRFTFLVPAKLAAVGEKSLIDKADEPIEGEEEEEVFLAINGADQIHIGLKYKGADGKDQWATRTATLSGDFFFDAMDRKYREEVEGVFVGESLYFRVIDPTRDGSDDKDVISLDLTTQSGKTRKLDLVETYSHSGVFKGLVTVVHAADKDAAADAVAMPAVYGDVLTAKYAQPKTKSAAEHAIAVFKGSDGKVVPFTKRFKDPGIAVRTQFMIAEAFFELAKRHRQLKQDSVARREIAQGRKLLEEAIRDYPDTQFLAQAEYLLADLSLEFGNDAVNEESRKKHYMDAIAKYSDIVATYPDSEYAPKSQYRKALAYEKMEMLDEACEEYVKLSYRYPENALVAETIARLGQYFLGKGRGLRETAEKETDVVKRERIRLKAVDMFKTAGQVFSRLAVRFPNHRLAGKTMLLSAQCFMQAEDYQAAVKGYTLVTKAADMDKDLVSEAMYWCGHSHMETNDLVKAYQMFKKLTWDYPASKWAKFARGRLADEKLANIEE